MSDNSQLSQQPVMERDYDDDKGLPPASAQEAKNTGNVIGGLKASLSNDNNSEEAKEHDRERLEQIEKSGKSGYGTTASTE